MASTIASALRCTRLFPPNLAKSAPFPPTPRPYFQVAVRQLHQTPSRPASSPIPPPPPPPKQQISIRTGDVSSKKWSELSGGQKIVRTAATGTSGIVVLTGAVVTLGIFYFVYQEIIAPDSTTNWFNRAHDRIRADPKCRELLGDGRIKAFGEPTDNRWARNRPIAHHQYLDPRTGLDHLKMKFNVEGDSGHGEVHLHLVRNPGESDYEYKYLFLDVPGKPRVYLENADSRFGLGGSGNKKSFLGVKWGW